MSVVIGGIGFNNAGTPPGGGTITGAKNGLSLSGTDVVLGGTILNITTVDLDDKILIFRDVTGLGAGKVLIGTASNVSGAKLVVANANGTPQICMLNTTNGELVTFTILNNEITLSGTGSIESFAFIGTDGITADRFHSLSGNNAFNTGGGVTLFGSSLPITGFCRIEAISDPNSGSFFSQLALVDSANGNFIEFRVDGANGFFDIAANSNITLRYNNDAIFISILAKASSGTIDASAIMEANSTTKGFLPPRMTQAERLAIASPAIGLMVYQINGAEGLYINTSGGWVLIS